MKKLVFVFLLACALALCLSACNSAQETIPAEGHESIGLAYTLSDDGTYYSVSGIGNCEDTDIVIPSMHNELPVKEIAYRAFYICTGLTSVVIPDSVTSIGEYAFYDCIGLKNIYYRGTASQWEDISKGNYWDYYTDSYTMTYNYTGQ